MRQIPYLLLDVDGVLIPFPAEDKSTPPTHTRHQVQMTGRPDPIWVWLNPRHGPLIADALSTGLFQPVWCSSWRADASSIIGQLLGLPAFEHVELPRLPITTSHPDGYLWKRDHIAEWADLTPTPASAPNTSSPPWSGPPPSARQRKRHSGRARPRGSNDHLPR